MPPRFYFGNIQFHDQGVKKMFGSFLVFDCIFMLIATSNNISFNFIYLIFFTRTDSISHRFCMKDMDFSASKRKSV